MQFCRHCMNYAARLNCFLFSSMKHIGATKTLPMDSLLHLFTVQKTIEICIMPFEKLLDGAIRVTAIEVHCLTEEEKTSPVMTHFIPKSGWKLKFINLWRWSNKNAVRCLALRNSSFMLRKINISRCQNFSLKKIIGQFSIYFFSI